MDPLRDPLAAREARGLTIQDAARMARVSSDYLRRIERHGGAPYVLACRLARLYGAPLDAFITTPKARRKARRHALNR